MKSIATLTMNPTIDVAYDVDRMIHTHKMRTVSEHYCPGGGGINVARVFVRLGGNARSIYMAGGATGDAFDGLMDLHQLVHSRVRISGHTRIATSALELETAKEYRFTPQGPVVTEAEWRTCLALMDEVHCDILVASGSLPRGVPENFYALVAARLRRRGIGIVLDTSGPALRQGLAEGGGVMLVKPSQGELARLAGRELDTTAAIAKEAMAIVERGEAKLVAVTLGHRGAVLARQEGATYLPALDIEARSAVGAGDSFLAAMVYGLASDWDAYEAFRYGMAGGGASVLNPGSGLAQPADIDRLHSLVPSVPSIAENLIHCAEPTPV